MQTHTFPDNKYRLGPAAGAKGTTRHERKSQRRASEKSRLHSRGSGENCFRFLFLHLSALCLDVHVLVTEYSQAARQFRESNEKQD